jgi:hypothetical protein
MKKKFVVHPPLTQNIVEDHYIVFATPRKLPFANQLIGKVVVLDIAFAHSLEGKNQPSITHDLISHLGKRLLVWIDHHDSEFHDEFKHDSRFILSTKAEHGACPEMIQPEFVQKMPKADTIVCHCDFDGIVSCAKWILNGEPPYPQADDDARAIDTRIGELSSWGKIFDVALKARKDEAFFKLFLSLLVRKLDPTFKEAWDEIDLAQKEGQRLEEQSYKLASQYVFISPQIVLLDLDELGISNKDFDRTMLLLLGQQKAKIAIIKDTKSMTFSSAFDSGVNFLSLFGISSGMPTVLSLHPKEWERCKEILLFAYP